MYLVNFACRVPSQTRAVQGLAKWQELQQVLWQADTPLTWSSAIDAIEHGALLTRAIVRELAQFGLLYEDDDQEVGPGTASSSMLLHKALA